MPADSKALHIPAAFESVNKAPFRRLDELTIGVFDCPHSTPKLSPDGPLVVRTQDIMTGVLRTEQAARVSEEIFRERIERAEPAFGDLLYSREGTYFGIAAEVPSGTRLCLGQRMVLIRPDRAKVDHRYLKYWLNSPQIAAHIHGFRDGSVAERLNLPVIRGLPVFVPDLAEQQAIAETLGSLDDKIEQNRRTGRKLEALARAVFKAWFVDFEPVKAKAAGATAFPGMPAETFAALPTRVVDSELGPVPEGWGNCWQRVSELERAGTLLIGDGYRAKRSELAEIGVPFIRAGNVNGTIITDGAELLGKPAIAKAGVKRSQVWDTVFTSKGTVGRIGLVTPATGDVVYAPQVCFWRAVNRDALSPFLLHLWVKSESFTCQWMSVKGQTDMADFVSLSDQRAMTMLVPMPEVQRGFEKIVRPIVEVMAASTAESAKLATLRDYLLPRLLSGRVRVRDAERAMEAV